MIFWRQWNSPPNLVGPRSANFQSRSSLGHSWCRSRILDIEIRIYEEPHRSELRATWSWALTTGHRLEKQIWKLVEDQQWSKRHTWHEKKLGNNSHSSTRRQNKIYKHTLLFTPKHSPLLFPNSSDYKNWFLRRHTLHTLIDSGSKHNLSCFNKVMRSFVEISDVVSAKYLRSRGLFE